MKKNKLLPVHPGEVLLEEFLKPLNVSQSQLARDIDVSISRVSDIVLARQRVTANIALRLGKYFGVEPEFWLNLQARYDLDAATIAIGQEVNRKVKALTRKYIKRHTVAA